MQPTLDFYFDFSSPYSYIGSNLIGPVAERYGRTINWRPILLGAAFQHSGQRPLVEIPIKGEYSRRDFERSARFHGLPYRHPPSFPIATVNTARAVLVVQARNPDKTGPFALRALRAFFAENRAINEPAVIGEIATELGLDAQAITAAIREPAIKEQLKRAVDEGIARGVFGAPFMFVDGEPFWGHDRIAQVERWLGRGPF